MDLGEKLRRARLEAGMTQRQLCAGEITRNMLSQIENGTARPSMKTLGYLAGKLQKPISYFLEESAVVSPNIPVMDQARQFYDQGCYAQAVEALGSFSRPDPVYERERDLIWVLCHLALARQALDRDQALYAAELLEKADLPLAYCSEDLRRRRLLLLGQIPGQQVSQDLPSLDQELLLRAREAAPNRAAQLLDAAQDQTAPGWNLLRGRAWMAQGNFPEAVRCLHLAEERYPRQTAPLLEQCYKETGDFRRAYEYACKQR